MHSQYLSSIDLVLFQGIQKEKVSTYTTDENGTWRGVVAPLLIKRMF
ncbi:hypothetical protein [Nostoc sp.]